MLYGTSENDWVVIQFYNDFVCRFASIIYQQDNGVSRVQSLNRVMLERKDAFFSSGAQVFDSTVSIKGNVPHCGFTNAKKRGIASAFDFIKLLIRSHSGNALQNCPKKSKNGNNCRKGSPETLPVVIVVDGSYGYQTKGFHFTGFGLKNVRIEPENINIVNSRKNH